MSKELKIEDIPYDLTPVAEFMGIKMFVDFCDKFGGSHFYIPNKKSILRANRNEEILQRYNGTNSKQLAKEYGISEIYLKSIIRKNKF